MTDLLERVFWELVGDPNAFLFYLVGNEKGDWSQMENYVKEVVNAYDLQPGYVGELCERLRHAFRGGDVTV